MKKVMSVLLAAGMVLGSQAVYADHHEKGASEQAQEHASDQAIFHRTSDWFATIGKNKDEKAAVKAKRRADRDAKKAEKQARKKQKEAEKELKKAKGQVEAAAQ